MITPLNTEPQKISDIQQKAQDALAYFELDDKINLELLQKWVNETNNPMAFIMQVFQTVEFESEMEIEKLLTLLVDFWNATPREEFGGLTPIERLKQKP